MLLFFLKTLLLFEADKGAGGGGVTDPPAGEDRAAGLQSLLSRHQNDAMRVVETLYRENYDYREQLRGLRAQMPAEGSVVLAGDDATAWQTYRQLGDAAALQQGLSERDQARQELTTLRQDLTLRDVAAAVGFDVDVLRTVGGNRTYTIKDETVNGKAMKVVYITDGDQETALTAYADKHWQKFLPALRPNGTTTPAPRGTAQGARGGQQQRQGVEQPRDTQPQRSHLAKL